MKSLLTLLLLCASPALALGEWGLADYGYEHRANGMDWDDDFVYGEATDDGKACDDADTDGATIVIEDIDGDSDDEAQIYVIPATGTDDSNCGGPNAADACETVQYAIDNRLDTGSFEDIICLVGTAHEELGIGNIDGDAGTKARTATGDEVYDFQYPSNPNVIMGADRDQDGEYPPYDTDDTAVFDGEVGESYLEVFLTTSIDAGTNDTDRWEFAHLTVTQYGTDGVKTLTDPVNGITLNENGASADTIVRLDGGSFVTDRWSDTKVRIIDSLANDGDYSVSAVSASTLTLNIDDFSADDAANTSIRLIGLRGAAWNRGMFHVDGALDEGYPEDHIYYHDIYGYRVMYRQEQLSYTQVFYELWGRRFNYVAMENIACIECCGYISRGNARTSSFIRVRNTSLSFVCEDDPEKRVDHSSGTGTVKHWGATTGIEYLNNDWDFDVTASSVDAADAALAGSGAFVFNTCTRDVYMINNIIRNVQNGYIAQAGTPNQCTSQTADNHQLLRNRFIIDISEATGSYPRPMIGVKLAMGSSHNVLEDVIIANNYFIDYSGEGWLSQIFKLTSGVSAEGADPTGDTIAIVGNTGYSENWGESGAATEQPIFMFDDNDTDQAHAYVIKNNVIAGSGADDVPVRWISSGVGCSDVDMDYNVYETAGGDRNWWGCDNQRYTTLDLYSAATGLDTHSKGEDQNACDVAFVNRGSDMHLDTSDTCAREEGTSVSAYTTVDFDKDSRPQSTLWDIGADEYSRGYVPEGACCTSGVCSSTTEAACSGATWQGAGTTCTPDPCEPPVIQPGDEFAGVPLSGVTRQ